MLLLFFNHFSVKKSILKIHVKWWGVKQGVGIYGLKYLEVFSSKWHFYKTKFFPNNNLSKYINSSNTVLTSHIMAKFIIVSMIKPICKYLARVGNKISCPKLGTYYQLLCAKQRRKAGVILGQNHVQLLNATLDSLFFFKCFIKSSVNML